MANVVAATRYLASMPVHGDTLVDQATRGAIDLLKTAITQQAQYSQGFQYLHETPYHSASRQAHSPAPAGSSHRQRHAPPPDPPGAIRLQDIPSKLYPERRIEQM